jgi:hypothetical protein
VKPNSFFISVCLFATLFIGSISSYAGIEDDSIRPLTQVNKEFLIIAQIVRDQSGAAGISQALINTQIASVNTIFAPIGVSFKVCEFRYIDNYNYNDLNTSTDPIQQGHRHYDYELLAKYNVNNRINMYFVDLLEADQAQVCGLGSFGGVDISSDNKSVLIGKSCATPLVIAHELGHYFDLSHPFANPGTELVNGSNCATAGDQVCDTPADPYIYGQDIKNYIDVNTCLFNYTGKDANGQYYDPDVSNIMSYYTPCVCLKFTHDQYEKMAQYYLSNPITW